MLTTDNAKDNTEKHADASLLHSSASKSNAIGQAQQKTFIEQQCAPVVLKNELSSCDTSPSTQECLVAELNHSLTLKVSHTKQILYAPVTGRGKS